MNLDAMRWIDRNVGVPLLALATLILRCGRTLSRRRPHRDDLRCVLFIELSELGSLVPASLVVQRILHQHGARPLFVTFEQNVPAIPMLGLASERDVFPLRPASLVTLAADLPRFAAWCRRKAVDTVIDLELFSRLSALLSALSGAERRVGFDRGWQEGLYRGGCMTHPVAYNPHIHIASNFMALAAALETGNTDLPYIKQALHPGTSCLPSIVLAEKDRERAVLRIREQHGNFDPATTPLILLNPNAGDILPQRRWAIDRYAELAIRILATWPDCIIAILGSSDDAPRVDSLCHGIADSRCVSMAGRTTLQELLALLRLATLLISNDSGPAQLAAAVGTPTVVLFGPETPSLYSPLGDSVRALSAGLACSPCVSATNHRKTSCHHNVCMDAISVEAVWQAILPFLSAGDSRQ